MIVREHIDEKFTQDSDPIADMNIGMMHQIKLWMKSIDEPFENKDNALVYSVINEKLDFVEYLLATGADVHTNNDRALRWASKNGHTGVIKVLLAAGADVHAMDDYALRYANNYGHTETVKLLLAAGADVHTDNDYALRGASGNGHTEVVKVLLAAGADVHADNDGSLRWASDNGHTEVVKLLLAAGADVHTDNDYALRWASINGHTEVVKVLKDHIAKEKRKKVKESVNEKFTEDSDPIHNMSIGIKSLIEKWLEKFDINNYKINDDNTIDVFEKVNLKHKNLTNLPEYIKFNEINGSFSIQFNVFTSLKGCPEIVNGLFSCSNNILTSLEYAPKKARSFYCHHNKKKFSVEEVKRYCNVRSNYITIDLK